MKGENIKRIAIQVAKFAIMVFVVWYLFRQKYLTEKDIFDLFRTENIHFVLLAGFAYILTQVLSALRFICLLRGLNFFIPLGKSFKLIIIGNFFNNLIPGNFGGDLIKGFHLIKIEQQDRWWSIGTIIMDRLFGILALCCISGLSFFYLLDKNNQIIRNYLYELNITSIIAASLFAGITLLFVMGKRSYCRSRTMELLRIVIKGDTFNAVADGVKLINKKRDLLILLVFISILLHLVSLMGLLTLTSMVGNPHHDALAVFAVSSIVMLISIVPVTPGNIGWLELIAGIGWSLIGSAEGARIFAYWRIIAILCSLPGGVLYLISKTSSERVKNKNSLFSEKKYLDPK